MYYTTTANSIATKVRKHPAETGCLWIAQLLFVRLGLFWILNWTKLRLNRFTLCLHACRPSVALGCQVYYLPTIIKATVKAHVVRSVHAITIFAYSHLWRSQCVV